MGCDRPRLLCSQLPFFPRDAPRHGELPQHGPLGLRQGEESVLRPRRHRINCGPRP